MKPTAAPSRFPYTEHRNMAEVMEAEERDREARRISRARQYGYELENG